ncbi:hypothetical protein MSIMFB_02192 [Mycobacterium simulans]|uniref:Secreted protein n=1 Tax=Mycobacterium simulans TaxID=627089 RepID=A0A7Z7ILJ3_9MYCO|nr:hypothetical protein [Mycobacterium simulans]SOJ54699.1 hypothetical protein MSIMFB_02192 [Mycobacterium simulans]
MKHAEKDRTMGLHMPRSRGVVCGLILVILGAWGALIPFVGPHFDFAYTPNQVWTWTTARGWLEVLPGAATAVGGLLLIASRNRVTAIFGGWLAVLAGAWFVVGEQVAPLLRIGSVGDPIAATERKRALLEVSYFSGLGALIIFVGGVVLARVAVRLARDIEPFTPAETVGSTPEIEPYRDESYLPTSEPADVSSGAVTRPRVEQVPPPEHESRFRRRFRREREGAAAGTPNAYLRWPHPQQ